MYAYRTPGVYFEWQKRASSRATIHRTDCAGFVGITERGPLHTPVKIENWSQFTSIFGKHIPQGYLAYAVEGFFKNGGRKCWIVRVADPTWASPAKLVFVDDLGKDTLRLTASSPGVWAENIIVTILRTSLTRFTLIFRVAGSGQEVWPNLSMEPVDSRYVLAIVNSNSGSQWVVVEDLKSNSPFPKNTPNISIANASRTARLKNGNDGIKTLTPAHFIDEDTSVEDCWGLTCLNIIDEVSIVAIPDLMEKPRVHTDHKQPVSDCSFLKNGWDLEDKQAKHVNSVSQDALVNEVKPTERGYPPVFSPLDIGLMQTALIRHCAKLRDRVAILDTRHGETDPQAIISWRQSFDTSYAGLYFPWVSVPDALQLSGLLRTIPPSGHVAGVYARGDLSVGVHKPPANQTLERVQDVELNIDSRLYGYLNDYHINVIRSFNGRGISVAGARTLSSDPELRYINVRRLISSIVEAIEEYAQELVFEPNIESLWSDIKRVVESLLDRLWRAGMLDGASEDQAYSVRCDAETNSRYETDLGRVICHVGILPPWPAEFVVIKIGFTESGVEVLGESD